MNYKYFKLISYISFTLFFISSGCEKKYSGTIDPVNVPPVISNLDAPDGFTITSVDTIRFAVHIDVYDPDGKDDISKVYFDSYRPDNSISSRVSLFNDGDGIFHGDISSNDNIYSNILSLPPTTKKGTWRFEFIAIDKSDEPSNIISHNITIK